MRDFGYGSLFVVGLHLRRFLNRPPRIVAVLVLLAGLLAFLSSLVGCSGQVSIDVPQTPKSSEGHASAAPLSPSPSPSASQSGTERSRAVENSKQAFADFLAAVDRLGSEGGADELPAYVNRYLTPSGSALSLQEGEASALKANGWRWLGKSKILSSRNTDIIDLDGEQPVADWEFCVDQTGVAIIEDGKEVDRLPYIKWQAELHLNRAMSQWQVHELYGVPSKD